MAKLTVNSESQHTRATMTIRKALSTPCPSQKLKLNTRSSTEAELMGVDNSLALASVLDSQLHADPPISHKVVSNVDAIHPFPAGHGTVLLQ